MSRLLSGMCTGIFAVASPSLDGANWQMQYLSQSVLVNIALPGDYNFSGVVDAADYVVWRATLGSMVTAFTGADGDGDRNRLEGGTINGPGQLVLDFGHGLAGHGTINSDIQFFDVGTRVAADDGILTINGDFLGAFAGSTGTDDVDGILNVVNPWASFKYRSVTLNGGELRGGTITNHRASKD